MKPAFLVLASMFAGFPVLAEFDLRQELDRKAFRESGLEKLSPGELENLNAAVAQLLGIQEEIIRAETELPQGDDRFGLETVKQRVQNLFQSSGPEAIESRIIGEFTGWGGGTRFRLENGQVWRQTDSDSFVVRKRENPRVFIRRGLFGGYLLKIEGYNSSCKVERVE